MSKYIFRDGLVVTNIAFVGALRVQSHIVRDHQNTTFEFVDALGKRIDRVHAQRICRFGTSTASSCPWLAFLYSKEQLGRPCPQSTRNRSYLVIQVFHYLGPAFAIQKSQFLLDFQLKETIHCSCKQITRPRGLELALHRDSLS